MANKVHFFTLNLPRKVLYICVCVCWNRDFSMCMLATNWCNSNSLGLNNFSSLGQFYVEDQVVRGDSKRLTELTSQKSRKSHTQIILITLVIGVTPGLHCFFCCCRQCNLIQQVGTRLLPAPSYGRWRQPSSGWCYNCFNIHDNFDSNTFFY